MAKPSARYAATTHNLAGAFVLQADDLRRLAHRRAEVSNELKGALSVFVRAAIRVAMVVRQPLPDYLKEVAERSATVPTECLE